MKHPKRKQLMSKQVVPTIVCEVSCIISGAWTIGAKGPWPPSEFGPHKKRQYSPLDRISRSLLSQRGDPWLFFDRTPSLANLQAPLCVIKDFIWKRLQNFTGLLPDTKYNVTVLPHVYGSFRWTPNWPTHSEHDHKLKNTTGGPCTGGEDAYARSAILTFQTPHF